MGLDVSAFSPLTTATNWERLKRGLSRSSSFAMFVAMHYWKCPFCGHQPPTARWATAQQYAATLQSILDTLKPTPVPSSPISFDVHPGFFKPQPAQLALLEKTSPKHLLEEIV